MAQRRRGGFKAPGNYEPKRGKNGQRSRTEQRLGGGENAPAQRGKHSDRTERDQRKDSAEQTRGAAQRAQPLPALPAPPPAKLQAKITTPADVTVRSFAALGLGDNIVRSLAVLGAKEPFAIQAVTIPDALAGHHVLGRGRTGSGKTIAFAAALVERLLLLKAAGAFPADAPKTKPQRGERVSGARRADKPDSAASVDRRPARRPKALILAPTRELALQIDRTVQPIARSVGLFTGQFVGGQPFEPQLHALHRGVDIVIGTPGRIQDLIKRGHLDPGQIAVTVIDEADHMAELGFIEPVQNILRSTRRGGQRLLFSASLDGGVSEIVREFMPQPAIHEVREVGASGKSDTTGSDELGAGALASNVEHRVLLVMREDKNRALLEFTAESERAIVFCRTRAYADQVCELLTSAGVRALPLHGDLSQARRERNLEKFTLGKVDVLVATDVAARGIHVDDVRLVLQADPPDDAKSYLHRAGRTGRVDRDGTVITLIPRTRQKRTAELFAELGIEPQLSDYTPAE